MHYTWLQLAILKRGLQLLSSQGKLVYSTCSLNPIENEAVVAAALQASNGAVRLVPAELPKGKLKKVDGIRNWKVASGSADASDSMHSTYEDWEQMNSGTQAATKKRKRGAASARVVRTMFAPSDCSAILDQLHHCARVLPNHYNSGGFFLACFEKVSDSVTHGEAADEETVAAIEAAEEAATEEATKRTATMETTKEAAVVIVENGSKPEIKEKGSKPASTADGTSGEAAKHRPLKRVFRFATAEVL